MIEAMACGTPVIAWRCGSVPEIVDHGVTGFIVATEDEAVAALARLHLIDRRAGPRRVRATLHRHGDGPQLPAALLAAVRRHRAVGHGTSPARAGRLNVDAAVDADEPREPTGRLSPFVLKHGDSFVVADGYGDIHGDGDGLFHDDTRILLPAAPEHRRHAAWRCSGAAVSQDNVLFTAHLTNRPLPPLGGPVDAARASSTSSAPACCGEDRLYERLRLRQLRPRRRRWLPLRLEFAADFRDMFEVRGAAPPGAGHVAAVRSSPAMR